jgi:hypothetical protein
MNAAARRASSASAVAVIAVPFGECRADLRSVGCGNVMSTLLVDARRVPLG